ncbi:MAG: Hpt domain-containing protein, partial [Roseomonas sp.]|nr:Hpt domain-containing protein [Roseomonas sp.]
MEDLLAEFLAETSEALADLDTALVALERQGGDKETLAQIFRTVHSVKGAAGFLGLHRLGAVAHAAENLLGLYRDGAASVSPAGVTAVLGAVDAIRTILSGLAETGTEPAGDDAALVAALDAAANGDPAPVAIPSAAASAPVMPEGEKVAVV